MTCRAQPMRRTGGATPTVLIQITVPAYFNEVTINRNIMCVGTLILFR